MNESISFSYPWLPTGDTHSVVCCICEGEYPLNTVLKFILNESSFTIQHCTHDDLLFLVPQPGAAYIEALYNHSSYFAKANDAYGHLVTPEKGKQTATFRLQEIRDHNLKSRNFLEVGCGLGYTLEIMKSAGIDSYGIEFSEESVNVANSRDLNVVLSTIESPIPDSIRSIGPYDIIALYSVLEHLPNPRIFLDELVPLLAPGGTLIVRVPHMSSAGPWLSLLDHFWHFTPNSLKHILANAGFTIYDQFASGTFVGEKGDTLESMTVFARRT